MRSLLIAAIFSFSACIVEDEPPAEIPEPIVEEPAQVEIIASSQAGPTGIALASDVIYWTTNGPTPTTGALSSCDVGGCPAAGPTLVYQEAWHPLFPTVVGQNIYLLTAYYERGSGAVTNLTPTRGAILGDGGMEFMSMPADSTGLVATSSQIYFAISFDGGSMLAACPLEGCPDLGQQVFIIDDDPGPISALDADSFRAFYAQLETATIATNDGEVLFEGEIAVSEIEHDAARLYWSTALALDAVPGAEVHNYIASGPRAGGEKEILVEVGPPVTALHLDGDWLYYADTTGAISRVPASGGDVEIVAENQGEVRDIDVDASHLYWVVFDEVAGSIRRLEKPQ